MPRAELEWEKWGKQDPYFGVLSDPKFSLDSIEDHRDEFFRSGEEGIGATIARFERSFGPLARGSALDFGCGVGRLTLALARRFETVVGVDVSPSMLAEAERNARARGLANCAFRLAGEDLDAPEDAFDFVNTYIVLQHIPVARGMRVIERLIRSLRPGGGFLIHFSVRNAGALGRARNWTRYNLPLVENILNLARGRPPFAPVMQMNAYRVLDILELLEGQGIVETLMATERHGGILTIGLIGRKPGPQARHRGPDHRDAPPGP